MTIVKIPIKTCKRCTNEFMETIPTCPTCGLRDCEKCGGIVDGRHLYEIKLFAGQRFLCDKCRLDWLDSLETDQSESLFDPLNTVSSE